VAGRLGMSDALVRETLLRPVPRRPMPSARPAPSGNGGRPTPDRIEQQERAFLALCIALPEEGEERLGELDPEERFTAPATRRAAAYLRGRLRSPAGDLPAGDEDLARLIAELVIRAGQLDATPATLELESLQLDLHRLDRRIAAARTGEGAAQVHDLATERQRVLDAIRHRLT
jgi:DNA primase